MPQTSIEKPTMHQASTQSQQTIHIAYGSESGNAHTLAIELKETLAEFSPTLYMLDELSPQQMTQWTPEDILFIITSTTGNGEAPYNATTFYQALVQKRMQQRMKSDTSTINCRYGVFGIGDVNYDNFCGFSKMVDGMLTNCGATAIAKRVDADVDYEAFFDQWSEAVLAYLSDKEDTKQTLASLSLQVDPNA